jgi:hypothetical protein
MSTINGLQIFWGRTKICIIPTVLSMSSSVASEWLREKYLQRDVSSRYYVK